MPPTGPGTNAQEGKESRESEAVQDQQNQLRSEGTMQSLVVGAIGNNGNGSGKRKQSKLDANEC